jgi:ParB-like chromosome segregation protein Spo0J
MRDVELNVVEVSVDDLQMYKGNSKIHTHENVDNIANSIERFGYVNPVLAWHNDEGDMEIVGGHGRVMAAKKVGLEKVPVILVDHLSDRERRALSHVLNQTTLSTGFDMAILDQELEELGDEFDFESFGFDVLPEVDIDSFFEEETVEKGTAPKTVTCPHCGEEFEL